MEFGEIVQHFVMLLFGEAKIQALRCLSRSKCTGFFGFVEKEVGELNLFDVTQETHCRIII